MINLTTGLEDPERVTVAFLVDDSTPANLAAGDAFAARIRTMLDEVIARTGLDAPPVERDDADIPVDLDPPPWSTPMGNPGTAKAPGLRPASGGAAALDEVPAETALER